MGFEESTGMKHFIYNPINSKYKSPVGAISKGNSTTFNLEILNSVHIESIELIIQDDAGNVHGKYQLNKHCVNDNYFKFTVTFKLDTINLYWYYFKINNGEYFLCSRANLEAQKVYTIDKLWPLQVHEEFHGDFSWYKGKVMYQIFVDRFFKGGHNPVKPGVIMHESWDEEVCYKPVNGEILNIDFFGGDLDGIIKKLPYLKALNVGVIYLNPIFEARSNHKYDTGDYLKIDSMFGTEDTFIKLITKAKEVGIEIILDGVFNHTGDDSVYFNKHNTYDSLGAYQSQDSKYYSWYRFNEHPHNYDSWWGFLTLPAVNQKNAEFLDFLTSETGVISKWMNLGAKGFRLDVVDELNDNFVELINQAVKRSSPDNIVIGEVWEEAVTKVSYGQRRAYFNGRQIDTVMNYPVKKSIFAFIKYNDSHRLKTTLRQLINNYPKHSLDLLMNHLGTHDTSRLLNNFARVNGDNLSKDQQAHYVMRDEELASAIINLKLATILQFTLPGVPCIYYGDEIGTQGFRDPFCRRTFKWDNINEDLLSWYQLLGRIRSTNNCFIAGTYVEHIINEQVFSFKRISADNQVIVIVNNGNTNYVLKNIIGTDLISQTNINDEVLIKPKTGAIIRLT